MSKNNLIALIVGYLFALGLGIAGMTQPQKIIGFLDLFSEHVSWDPSLLFVMIGAIAVHALSYQYVKGKTSPLFSSEWYLPTKKEITPSLIIGSLLFGIGWGLGGYCPGPALTALASFDKKPAIFVFSMVVGMLLYRGFDKFFPVKK